MGLRINLNTAALSAHRRLAETDGSLNKTIERLSSGYKINTASDDPAGLVISEKLRAQASGLGQAIANAGDAVNMVKTAEGALSEVQTLLSTMRDLAVHAANTGANDDAAVAADQEQINNAIASINKIAQETQFGKKALLDGSAGIKATVTGTSVTSGDFSSASGLKTGDSVSVNVVTAAQKAYLYTADFGTDSSFVTNAVGTFSLTINGVQISYTSQTTVAGLRSSIQGLSDQTGVTVATTTDGQIDLVSTTYGTSADVTVSGGLGILNGGVAAAQDFGVDASATVQVNGANITDSQWSFGDGQVLRDSLGNEIVLTEAAATTTGNKGTQFTIDVGTLIFQVGAYSGQTRELNIQAMYAQYLGTTAVAGQSVSTIDLSTPQGAQNAIDILDDAIQDVSSIRADLGATQTYVFESSINSLTVAQENIKSSESTIRDTDMAADMVELTRLQVLNQAGTSMLAQANQIPQNLLKLLQ